MPPSSPLLCSPLSAPLILTSFPLPKSCRPSCSLIHDPHATLASLCWLASSLGTCFALDARLPQPCSPRWWSAAWDGTCSVAPRVRCVIPNHRFPGWRRGGSGRGRALTKLRDARLGIIIWVFVVGSHSDFDGRRVPHLAQGSQIKGRGRERERKKVIYSVCLQKVSDYLSISNKEIP